MWVDIANLMGPKGADGADGQKGEPGPVNIGLNPDEPIAWDQTGGFTFQFVDGSAQTVNLPIASAQSAGLLGAGGSMPTTGLRNINGLIVDSAAPRGVLALQRTGPMVVITATGLQMDGTGSSRLCVLPSGFRPPTNIQTHWNGRAFTPDYVDIYASGSLWAHRRGAGENHAGIFTYLTLDSWPSSLPGVPQT